MQETFIERGIEYELDHAHLILYETNAPCKNIEFIFDTYTITMMIAGHKTITSDPLKLEFFPGTLFIPHKNITQDVAIPNASFDNPTKCLVLTIESTFLRSYLDELLVSNQLQKLIPQNIPEASIDHFISNDKRTLRCFERIYEYTSQATSEYDRMIVSLQLKELILRLLQTPCYQLLFDISKKNALSKEIDKTIRYIKANIRDTITLDQLIRVSGLGRTTLHTQFKKHLNTTPAKYILNEKISLAKRHIAEFIDLKALAYECGFNSYENFSKSFKRIEGESPSAYKKKMLLRSLSDV